LIFLPTAIAVYPDCVPKGYPNNIIHYMPFICYETLIQLNFIAYFLWSQTIFPFQIITNDILVTFYSQMVNYKLIFYSNCKSIFFFFQKYYYLQTNFINIQVFLCSLVFILQKSEWCWNWAISIFMSISLSNFHLQTFKF
jgi:hypothetical protein